MKNATEQPRIDMASTCTMCPACGGRDVVISNGTMACVRCSTVSIVGALPQITKRATRNGSA